MAHHHEVELTWAVTEEARLPELSAVPGVVTVGAPVISELDAVYFDTDDLALVRAGVTLRRRVGGTDEGWHLKVPAGAGRDEVHLPLDRARHVPPKPLRDAVTAWSRGAALRPVATIATHRTTYGLLGADGAVLAELADDRVTGTSLGEPSAESSWREWELELVDGDTTLLEAATRLLAEAGVEVSPVQRKIERVLGDRVPRPPRVPRPKPARESGRVLQRLLVEQAAELARRDSEIRRGEPDAVHTARVATRRMRSALATYRPLVDPGVADPIRRELGWLARTLGDARDLEVACERLLGMVDAEPAAFVVGPVRARIAATYAGREGAATGAVTDALDSRRYLDLLAALDRLTADPPWTEQAGEPARDVVRALVLRDWDRLRDRVEAIAGAEDRDVAVHEARKAAKRLRYVVEALVPAWGRDARRLAKAGKQLSQLLGERQDSVVTRRDLLALAEEASASDESTFTYGRLHALEQERAARLDRELEQLWARVSRKRLRAWLS